MFTFYLGILLLIINQIQITVNLNHSPIVELPLGKVEGTLRRSVNGTDYFSFEGIPYAKPPTGQYRFRVSISNIMGTGKFFRFYCQCGNN